MRVQDIMAREPACCTQSFTAQMAASLMQQWDCGALPVVDDLFRRRIMGIVTDRDLCLKVLVAGRDPAHVYVHEAMTRDPICCHAQDDAQYALALMTAHHVRRVPVVNDHQAVVGMVSLGDLVRYGALSEPALHAALCRIYEPLGALGREIALASSP
jgi:CBS domain-containing protein